jgi:ABC-2 type transport system ATP-binding protein
MTSIVLTEKLSRRYGNLKAVDSVHLDVRQGEIYGFLGLNGAGKTTTIRMLLGMIRPSEGRVFLFGRRIEPGSSFSWNDVGHLVEIPYAYPSLTVRENLEIFRRLRFLKERNVVNEVIEKLQLGSYADIKARNLSLGNSQRLGLAKALMHKPRLLILDEPANGLDPYGIVQIRELLLDLSQNHGVTIFVSSHILGEIAKFASRIGIIHDGRMIQDTDTAQLKNNITRVLRADTSNNAGAARILKNLFRKLNITENGSIEIADPEALNHPERVCEILVSEGLPPKRLVVEEEDLEHYFFRILRENSKSL